MADLTGRPYLRRLLQRGQNPASDWLCGLCEAGITGEPATTVAAYWDHCHDHGTIRGPVCRTCNGRMGSIDSGRLAYDIDHQDLDHPRSPAVAQGLQRRAQLLGDWRLRCPDCTNPLPPPSPRILARIAYADARRTARARIPHDAHPRPCQRCPVLRTAYGLSVPPRAEWKTLTNPSRYWSGTEDDPIPPPPLNPTLPMYGAPLNARLRALGYGPAPDR